LGIIGLVVLSLIAAVLIFRDTRTSKLEITENASDALKSLGIEMTGEGKVEVVPIDDTKLPPAPSLSRVFTPLSTISPEVIKAVQTQMANTIENLKKIQRVRTIGLRSEERERTWEIMWAREMHGNMQRFLIQLILCLGTISATSIIFYLKNYVKSEENWKKTITLKPEYIQGYRGLYELYTYSMKEKSSEIPVILKQGIVKNPSSTI